MNKIHKNAFFILFLFFLVLTSPFASAEENLESQKKALDLIADFADRLCKSIPIEGTAEQLQLSGKAKAELSSLIKKIADVGIEGAANYQKSEYQGLLQKDLANLLKNNTNCRLAVWNDLKDKFITNPNTSTSINEPCRHPAHGIESWAHQEKWNADSGWRKGGSSPAQYCGAAKLARENEYPGRKVDLLATGEDHRVKYDPFKRDEYRYKCSFIDYWGPIYKLAVSENCPK